MERMMKLQDVLLKAMAKKITWWAAAEIIGVSDRRSEGCGRSWNERAIRVWRTGAKVESAATGFL
jgi:hypothetical protein